MTETWGAITKAVIFCPCSSRKCRERRKGWKVTWKYKGWKKKKKTQYVKRHRPTNSRGWIYLRISSNKFMSTYHNKNFEN